MFRKMYFLLFHRITEAIGALDRGDAFLAKTVLIRAQQEAEALYIEGTEKKG